jgi:hypothetical protein
MKPPNPFDFWPVIRVNGGGASKKVQGEAEHDCEDAAEGDELRSDWLLIKVCHNA